MELTMHRTQIYLPDDLYESLKVRSRSVGVSVRLNFALVIFI
jgi:hypothetical protein